MDGYNKFEINTVPLRYTWVATSAAVKWQYHSKNGWLLLMFFNNRRTFNVYMPETTEVS